MPPCSAWQISSAFLKPQHPPLHHVREHHLLHPPPVVRTTAVKAELASIKSSIDSLLAMPVSRAAPNPLTPCLL
jgi:hypothetical protein